MPSDEKEDPIMGTTKVTTKITSLEGSQGSYEEVFLVDTGAIDSMAPANELEKIRVRYEFQKPQNRRMEARSS